jgi:GPR1/FUN34/yaaH family
VIAASPLIRAHSRTSRYLGRFATPGWARVRSRWVLFLVTWLIVIVMLTLATLRLPLAFTVVFVLIDVAPPLRFINKALPPGRPLLRGRP